jgi:hypothetical protein
MTASRLNRTDRIALVVLALTLFSIVALAWASAVANYQSGQEVASNRNHETSAQNADGQPEPVYFGLFRPSDSYAQWFMAVLSLAAAGISWRAIVLVRDQLIETRNAVKVAQDALLETRRIGEAQVRAYLGSPRVDARLETEDGTRWFRIDAYASNSGHSPAVLPSVSCFVSRGDDVLNMKHTLLERDISAGESDFKFLDQGHPCDDEMELFLSRAGELTFAGALQYYTVFGGTPKTTTFRFRLEKLEPGDGPFKVSVEHTLRDGTVVEHHRD